MRRRKKVMIFGSYAPSLVNFRGPLIAAIVSRGHDVIAVAPAIDGSTASALRALGAEPQELSVSNQSLNPVAMIRALGSLRELVRASRPDVLLSYTIKPVLLGAIAGRRERVSTVLSLITGAGYPFTGGREAKRILSRLVAKQLYRFALRRTGRIIFQNADDEILFRQMGMIHSEQASYRVNGSGVDLEHFAPMPLPPAVSFLMISRLLRDKGVREFAAASKRLKAEHPETPIHLVGYLDKSPDRLSERDLSFIRESGIEFHGRLDDVRPVIAQCSVYVLPSYREGTPRTVLEAMAMRRAIITTDAPGCKETVQHEVNGLLVPVGDADALYAAMKRLLLDYGLVARMAEQSREIVESKYDVKLVNADLLQIAGL
jgi:glycosyltransferase involved in cell wall biosynthesis